MTLSANTNNLLYGQTNNPYNPSRIPEGSSGGAAAIVASGGTAFDIGSDTAGSVRIPSYCCGVCGIKPTSGRVPRTGHIVSGKGYYHSLTTVAGYVALNTFTLALVLFVGAIVLWFISLAKIKNNPTAFKGKGWGCLGIFLGFSVVIVGIIVGIAWAYAFNFIFGGG